MDTDLKSLYQRTVLEHCRSPRNFRAIEQADRVAQGFNPLCGDKVTVYLRESPGRESITLIADISFEASGCAICLASASMMTELLAGGTSDLARRRAEQVLEAFRPEEEKGLGDLGDIVALGSVRAYPSRIRCVTLPWRTFAAALKGEAATVSTE